MAWEDFQTQAPATPPAPPAPTASHVRRPDGLRRALLTAGIAGALLVTGGVAVVFAASPDPSAGAPSTTTPSNGGTTAPNGGTTAPSGGRHNGQPCPNMGGSSGSGSDGGQSGQPAPDTTAPAT
jgi:large repetitive protein